MNLLKDLKNVLYIHWCIYMLDFDIAIELLQTLYIFECVVKYFEKFIDWRNVLYIHWVEIYKKLIHFRLRYIFEKGFIANLNYLCEIYLRLVEVNDIYSLDFENVMYIWICMRKYWTLFRIWVNWNSKLLNFEFKT